MTRPLYGWARRKLQTHCRHNHEFTPENTYVREDGTRQCRKCLSAASMAYQRRRVMGLKRMQQGQAG